MKTNVRNLAISGLVSFLLAAPVSQTVPAGRSVQFAVHAAGTPARARSIRFCAPNWLHTSGGVGHTSKTARGFCFSAIRRYAALARRSLTTPAARRTFEHRLPR